jgi:hypothetical protein
MVHAHTYRVLAILAFPFTSSGEIALHLPLKPVRLGQCEPSSWIQYIPLLTTCTASRAVHNLFYCFSGFVQQFLLLS